MLALHVLKKCQCLAERAERVLHAGLSVNLGRCVLGFEEGANGPRDILRQSKYLLGNLRVFL